MKDNLATWFDPAHPMNERKGRRMSVDELEALLKSDEEAPIEILPNGEIRAIGEGEKVRENLGG